ncbi:glutaryl-CoA dehydrogenase, partial [Streptomyces zinciresistens K42]
MDYARTREQFGRPIGGFQLTQAKLADMALELHKGILLVRTRNGEVTASNCTLARRTTTPSGSPCPPSPR